MLAAAVVDIGMMLLLSAVLNAGIPSALMMFVISGALPLLALATVSAIEASVKTRSVPPDANQPGQLVNLAARLRCAAS